MHRTGKCHSASRSVSRDGTHVWRINVLPAKVKVPYNGEMNIDEINAEFPGTGVGMAIGDVKKMPDEARCVL